MFLFRLQKYFLPQIGYDILDIWFYFELSQMPVPTLLTHELLWK